MGLTLRRTDHILYVNLEQRGQEMYTAEIYKRDGRTKQGERLVLKEDFTASLESITLTLDHMYPRKRGYRVEIRDTYVTRTNSMTGKTYRERYDTPRACSPASDLYWSM